MTCGCPTATPAQTGSSSFAASDQPILLSRNPAPDLPPGTPFTLITDGKTARRIARGRLRTTATRIQTRWLGLWWRGLPAPIWWASSPEREQPFGCGCIAALADLFDDHEGWDTDAIAAAAKDRLRCRRHEGARCARATASSP